jgi:hypothetical protein
MSSDRALISPTLLLLLVTPVEAVNVSEIVVISISGVAILLFLLCLYMFLCRPAKAKEADPTAAAATDEVEQGGGGALTTAKNGVKAAAGKASAAAGAAAGVAGSVADRALDGMEGAVGVSQDGLEQAAATVTTVFSSTKKIGESYRDNHRRGT